MKKIIYIINGKGGTGKDTVCELASKYYRVRNISSIDPIIKIAKFAGWNGEKTNCARRMLSGLKQVFKEYNDLSFKYCVENAHEFFGNDEQIMFVHIREIEEIRRFKDKIGENCLSILVRRNSVTNGKIYGNPSDDNVENFEYDYIIENNGSLYELEKNIKDLLEYDYNRGK